MEVEIAKKWSVQSSKRSPKCHYNPHIPTVQLNKDQHPVTGDTVLLGSSELGLELLSSLGGGKTACRQE